MLMTTQANPGSLTIRPLVRDDFPALSDLFRASFGIERPQAYERWRYLDTPLGITPGMVAVDGGRIVASYTVWPAWMELDGQAVKGGQSMDTMTHPDYRGRGLFPRLAAACYEWLGSNGFEVLYGFPNDAIYSTRIRRLNWDHTGDVPVWRRPILPGRAVGLPSPVARLVRTAISIASRRSKPARQCPTEVVSPEMLADLAAGLNEGKTGDCRIRRDADWFRWRYSPESGLDYQHLVTVDAAGRRACVIWREDRGRALVAEVLGDPGTLAGAVATLVKVAEASRLTAIEAVSTDPQVVRALKENGFWKRGRHRLITRSLTTRILPANIHDHQSWRLQGGDYDVY